MARASLTILAGALMCFGFALTAGPTDADMESGWETPVLVEYFDSADSYGSQVACDPFGNMFAVWTHYESTVSSVMASRYVIGHGWTAPLLLSHGWYMTSSPRIATDGLGNAFATYIQPDGMFSSVYCSRYTLDEGWIAQELIEDIDDDAYAPDIAADSAGNAVAVWLGWSGVYVSVYACVFTADEGWGSPEVIETHDGECYQPRVAMDATGHAVAVWSQETSIRIDVWGNHYDPESGWGTETLLESYDAGSAGYAEVAMDGSGNAMAAWYQYDGTRSNIYASRYDGTTGWESLVMVSDGENYAGDAQVDMDSDGNAFAVWRQYEGVTYSVMTSRYVSGAGWGSPELLEDLDIGTVYNPRVSANEEGEAFAIWLQSDSVKYNIWANRYVPGNGWEEAVPIEFAPGDVGSACVAVDSEGNAMALWYQEDTHVRSIYASRYVVADTTPPPLTISSPASGTETDAPTITVSGETEPGATLVVNGIMVAVSMDGSFSFELALLEGSNEITAVATDAWGNPTTVSVTVEYANPVTELQEEVYALENELLNLSESLNTTLAELEDTLEDLDDSLGQLLDMQEELDSTQDRLTEAEADISDTGLWKMLSAAGLIIALVAIIIALMMARSLSHARRERKLGQPREGEPPQQPMSSSMESAPSDSKGPEDRKD